MNRNLCTLTDEAIENLFSDIASMGITADDVVFTNQKQTLDTWEAAIKNYAQYRDIRRGVKNGFNYLTANACQPFKGQPRRDVCIVDFGDGVIGSVAL